MLTQRALRAAVVTVALAGWVGTLASGGPAVAAHDPAGAARVEASGERLGETIDERLRADGPWFTDEERAVIEQACGYPAGSWDGFSVSMSDDGLRCSNGRRVSSPEVMAVMDAARPRIEARVARVMESAAVRGAIAAVTSEATAEALRGAREAQAAGARALNDLEVRRALAVAHVEAARAVAEAHVDIEAAMRIAEVRAAEAGEKAEHAIEEARQAMREDRRERERRR